MYYSGQQVTISGTFTVAGTYTDPNTASLTITVPGSGNVTYSYPADGEVVRDDTGLYYVNYTLTHPGLHRFYWYATGGVNAANSTALRCLAAVPNG